MMNEKKISWKPFVLSFLILTIGCLLVYTSWKIAREPVEDGATVEESAIDVRNQPDVSTPEPLEEPVSPASAYQSANNSDAGTNRYRLYMEQGELLVYDPNMDESFPAGLDYELLPDSLRQEIDEGKYFDTEEALYEFLENYSS